MSRRVTAAAMTLALAITALPVQTYAFDLNSILEQGQELYEQGQELYEQGEEIYNDVMENGLSGDYTVNIGGEDHQFGFDYDIQSGDIKLKVDGYEETFNLGTIEEIFDVIEDPDVDYGPYLKNQSEMKELIMDKWSVDNQKLKFQYSGDKLDDIDVDWLNHIGAGYFCHVRFTHFTNDLSTAAVEVNLSPYPGQKMEHAWRTGDESGLNDREKETLKIAKQVVSEARANTSSDYECELYLHDWLCNRTVYYVDDTRATSPDTVPAFRNATGAILDGKACCMGYTDAFCLLGTIAGFQMDRQSCDVNQDDDRQTDHIFSTMKTSEGWVMIDATWDDDPNGVGTVGHHYFNGSKDAITDYYVIPESVVRYPICEKATSYYYYS